MQKNLKSIINEMEEDGYSQKEIICFVQGLHEGINTVRTSLKSGKLEITPTETDPLYIHTWNSIIETLDFVLLEIIKETFETKENITELNLEEIE